MIFMARTSAAESISIGHQTLHGDSWKLRQAVQVLKRVRECLGAGVLKKIPQPQLNSCGLKQGGPPASAGPQRLGDRIGFIVFSGEPLDLGVSHLLNTLFQISDTEPIHRIAKPDLCIELVSFGHRDIAHVVAEACDFQHLSIVPGAGSTHPNANLALHSIVLPGPNDDLALESQAGSDESEFPVAMSRLVEIHEIHVDR